MRKFLLLAVILSAIYHSSFTQTPPQTRTATYLNNLNAFRDVFGDQGYPRANAEDLAADDDIYGCSSRLIGARDSSGPFHNNYTSSLALQGFGFTIPDDAIIVSIAVKIRRFEQGKSPVGDLALSLMQRYQCGAGGPCTYGVFWTYQDDYPGKIYPDTETEYIFSQSGSGNNGGFNHDQEYQWTPAIVNHQFFGVRIDTYPPIGIGSAQVCYDQVVVTIVYSQPATIAGRSSVVAEAKPLKEAIIYPNPFTTRTNLQFIAVENGKAVVDLYNISGIKIRSIFSGNVVQGQIYNVAVEDALLPKGLYIYSIINGKQRQKGKIIKIE